MLHQVRLQAAYALGNLLLHLLLPARMRAIRFEIKKADTKAAASVEVGTDGTRPARESVAVALNKFAASTPSAATAAATTAATTAATASAGLATASDAIEVAVAASGAVAAMELCCRPSPWGSDAVWLSVCGCALQMLEVGSCVRASLVHL